MQVNNYCDALILYQYYLLSNATVKNFYKNRVPVFERCCYDNCLTLKGNNEIIRYRREGNGSTYNDCMISKSREHLNNNNAIEISNLIYRSNLVINK